jgi:DNA-binding SARP family transcriptional activator/TolB-like protein
MIELSLLGLHALRGSDGRELTSLPAQPKRFALLAYLAVGGSDGYHRRDTLTAVFWPELDQFAARRALRNTLYHLREALGETAIVTRGDEAVGINPNLLTSDVSRLHAALEAGRYEEAVDRFHGELLAGMHFAGAGEAFEEWLARERLRVTDAVLRAITALVAREEAADNLAAAAHWAQRACAVAPVDEGWLRQAMSLLDRLSDGGTALRLHEAHSVRIAAEFGAKPSAETMALATRIRTGQGSRLPPPAVPVVPQSTEVPAIPPAAIVLPSPVRAPRAVTRGRIWTIGVIAMVALAVLAVGLGHRTALATTRQRVLVTVFDNRTGDSTLQSLGRMTQDWLVQGLLRTQLVDVVDPRAVFVQARVGANSTVDPLTLAQRTGATLIVSGSYYLTGDTLFLQAAVTDARTHQIVRAVGPILAGVKTPVAAVEGLRSRVMSTLASMVDVHATQDLRIEEPPPFEAYRAYVDGWDAFWHGDGLRSLQLFLRAAQLDSTFTAAQLGAATAAANSGNCIVVDSLDQAMGRVSRTLPRLDQIAMAVAEARCHGRNDEMLRLTLERADLEPGSPAAQMSAAAAALWANRPARVLKLLARVDPALDLAWNTDTTHFAYWSTIAEAFHLLGRHAEELAQIERMPRGAPLGRAWLRGSALAAMGRPTAALALVDSTLTLPVETASDIGLAPFTNGRPEYTMTPAWVANWVARELDVAGDTVAAHQAARRALAWYRSRPAADRATPEERYVAVSSLEIAGAYAEAREMAEALVAGDSSNIDFRGQLGGLAAEQHDSVLADVTDRWLAAQPVARAGWSASVYRARIAALLGRANDAVARLREAFDAGMWPRWLDEEPALASLRGRSDFAGLIAPRD